MRLLIANKNYSSWSLRPWLVMRHFAVRFDEEFFNLADDNYKPKLAARSPSGRLPVLFDGELVICETLAIIEYVADSNPNKPIWPTDMASRALARSAAAEMHAGFTQLRNLAPMNIRADYAGRVDYAAIKADMRRLEILWGELLARSGGPYLFGDFSAADAMFAPVASRIRTYDIPVGKLSADYIDAIHDLPAFREWRASALEETWRIEEDELPPPDTAS